MRQKPRFFWTGLVVANLVVGCVLGFYRNSGAAPPRTGEPFANSVRQRAEMIVHLKEMKQLLKEQNALLRSGKVKVVVAQP